MSISTIKENAYGLGWYDKGVLYFKQDGRDKLFEKLKKKKQREIIEDWEDDLKDEEPYVRPKRAWEL